MSKKSPTGTERQYNYLSDDLWYELLRKNVRVRKLMLRGGLGDWLLIITATIEGEAKVGFVGSDSILGVARKVHQLVVEDTISWQEDKYVDKT